MALPTSRAELKTYIKTRLGEPVITVNVEDSQMDDRIDDALEFMQDYHYDASETIYLKHQLTASTLTLATPSTGSFANGELMTGSTSNCRGLVYTQANTTTVQFTYKDQIDSNQRFTVGETVIGSQSGATGTVQSIVLGDVDNEYVTCNPKIRNVVRVLGLGAWGTGSGAGMFSFEYQYLMNDMSMLSGGGSITPYYMTRSHMEMLHDLLVGDINVRFNRHAHRLYIDVDWQLDIVPGRYIVVEAQAIVDPDEHSDLWTNRFFRDYSTALVKKQWGQNLLKYNGVAMPGGITLNGQQFYDEGKTEAMELEQKIREQFETPPHFIVA